MKTRIPNTKTTISTTTRTAQALLRHLPSRGVSANKSHGGRVWVVAGSVRFPGAAVLTSTAAARVGAGYVGLSFLSGHQKLNSVDSPDFISLAARISNITDYKPNAVVLGPGIGNTLRAKKLASSILRELELRRDISVVVDADGLHALGNKRLPAHWILTPHSGELAKLLGWSVAKVNANRRAAAESAQKKYGCIIILKGHGTLIAASYSSDNLDNAVYINPTGNAALAKAGTGDVLAGIIGGLLAQKVDPLIAARLGCFIHGALADRWVASGNDPLSLMASDLLQDLPKALASLRSRKQIRKARAKV